MSDQEIIEKALQKANLKSWNGKPVKSVEVSGVPLVIIDYGSHKDYGSYKYAYEPFSVIFNHDFAKALWGESNTVDVLNQRKDIVEANLGWQWHLQQMVIADDPIKYLGEHL